MSLSKINIIFTHHYFFIIKFAYSPLVIYKWGPGGCSGTARTPKATCHKNAEDKQNILNNWVKYCFVLVLDARQLQPGVNEILEEEWHRGGGVERRPDPCVNILQC